MSSQAAATTSSSASVQKTIIHQKMHPKLLTGKEKEHRHKRFEQDDSATEQDDDDENSTDDECVAENNDEMSPQELVSLRRKMMTLPLAKLSQLKAKLGVALFNKTFDAVENEKNVNAGQTAVIGKKSNSKRPREESSTRPPPKLRPIPGLQPKKAKNARFDPRFSTDCGGQFDEVAFHRDYAFLDDFRQHDMQELQKAYRQAKKEKRIGQAERIKCNLQRLKNQQKASREQKLMQQIRAELRQTNIERMNGGQAPIYLNNNELKERFLERKTQLHGKGWVKEKGQPKISGRLNEEKEDAQKPFDEDGMGNKSNDH